MPPSVSFFFPHSFLSQLTATKWGEFKSKNSSGIAYPWQPFLVSIFLSCSLPIYPLSFFELSLATTIPVLTPVWFDHVTSINFDGKRARVVGLTCWCPHENMRQEITCPVLFWLVGWFFCSFFFSFFFFLWGETSVFLNQFHHCNISGCGEILNLNGFRQMGLIFASVVISDPR